MANGTRPRYDEPVGEAQGVWYTAGTTAGYARHRPDPTYPAEKYACVYPGRQTVYSGAMATYCAWHRPMAVYAPTVDRTFLVFGNPVNSPAISFYDHARDTFAAPVILGTNPNMDAHRNPTLLIDGDGFLYVFFGAHGDQTRVVKSTKPYDISQWCKAAPLSANNTYPQPWLLTPGELFVSYRAPPGWCFRTSVDRARSWSPRTELINFPGSSIYAVSVAASGAYPRKIHIAWERMGGGTPEEIRTKALWARRYNVYYACSDDGGATWRRSDGSAYMLPISEDTAERIHDSGERGVWLKDIQLDGAGKPHILFLDADLRTYDTVWKHACPLGAKWQISDITTTDHMYDAGGLVVLADDDLRLYGPTSTSQPHEDGGEIDEWRSRDGGATWERARRITLDSKYSHNHVKVVWNHQNPDFRVLWCYGDSTYPPATQDVYLLRYGEALTGPRQLQFPASCLSDPVVDWGEQH